MGPVIQSIASIITFGVGQGSRTKKVKQTCADLFYFGGVQNICTQTVEMLKRSSLKDVVGFEQLGPAQRNKCGFYVVKWMKM